HEFIAYVPIEFDMALLHQLPTALNVYSTSANALQSTATRLKIVKLPIPARYRLLRIAVEQFWLPYRIVTDEIDLLHCPGYIAVLRSPVPVVVTMYDILAITHPEWCRHANRIYYRTMLPNSANKAIRIIVPSNAVKVDVIHYLNASPEKVNVVPLGVEPLFRRVQDERVLDEVRRRFQLPGRFVLFVGNIEPKKNVPTLLNAYEQLRKRDATIGLVLAGAPAWGDGKVVQCARKLGAICTGYVSDDILPVLYSLASAFAFPSLYEGFGLPPLEAMACGTPVVTSNAGALPEVVDDAGVLIDPTDATELADALYKVLTDEALRTQLVSRGYRQVQRFTWERTATEVIQVYELITP
ncbi:MAG TPA: glycosyltransferase family 1 protein, partial [Armatimonadetes bacterium]|nr:glycosyltransferase family 1 protein [Armatimonadota bacterium]